MTNPIDDMPEANLYAPDEIWVHVRGWWKSENNLPKGHGPIRKYHAVDKQKAVDARALKYKCADEVEYNCWPLHYMSNVIDYLSQHYNITEKK